ncbi:hypothetical protein [Haladaptatus cibarius]|uniref:hypothetical protein n=1 Tax=Haladaptatus cibarius TaxID=453847 RepID=UPI00067898C3|nr:hypothetical protein [Haladaptatus cibarius]
MDAVKASRQIDHTDSVSQRSEFDFGHGVDEVLQTNMLVHMDGVFTPELIEEVGSNHVEKSDLNDLQKEINPGLITPKNLPYLEEDQVADLQKRSTENSLTDEQMQSIIRVNARAREVEDSVEINGTVGDNDVKPTACTVAAVCVAVVAVGVYNTVGAVHTAAAAVAVETYVGVT